MEFVALEGTNLKLVLHALQKAPREARGGMIDGLDKAATILERTARRIVYRGYPMGLRAGTGRLRQSITHEVSHLQMYAVVGTNVIYAPVHEFGATITPKQAKALAIPVGTFKGSPLRFKSLTRVPGGLMDPTGTMQYIFINSVKIPARPFLRPALIMSMHEMTNAIMEGIAARLNANWEHIAEWQ